MSQHDLTNRIAVLLGGRAAERLVFGEVSTGAQNDLLRATDIARAMVTEYGMSDTVGPVNHAGRRRETFLDTPILTERGAYAEETATIIDAEVKRIITGAEIEAARILTEMRAILDALSERLLEKEVVEGEELREMLATGATDRTDAR
jgi:cell division protease FtsH